LVEQRPEKPRVRSSILRLGTTYLLSHTILNLEFPILNKLTIEHTKYAGIRLMEH
jgi:hypothetical protein